MKKIKEKKKKEKEEWGWGPITEALSVYYTLPAAEVPTNGEEEFNAWVMHLSNATGYNLAPYHEAWGFPLTQSTSDDLEHLPVWVDDPLRGEYHAYSAIIRNLSTANVTSSTADVIWDVYDNGTNTTLTVYYGQADMGNNSQLWPNSVSVTAPSVGSGCPVGPRPAWPPGPPLSRSRTVLTLSLIHI
mgnify:CR=1 FL=1